MIFERNLPTFRKKMNHLQSESVLKKSPEEKRGIFLEKVRLELEQKKKELETRIAVALKSSDIKTAKTLCEQLEEVVETLCKK